MSFSIFFSFFFLKGKSFILPANLRNIPLFDFTCAKRETKKKRERKTLTHLFTQDTILEKWNTAETNWKQLFFVYVDDKKSTKIKPNTRAKCIKSTENEERKNIMQMESQWKFMNRYDCDTPFAHFLYSSRTGSNDWSIFCWPSKFFLTLVIDHTVSIMTLNSRVRRAHAQFSIAWVWTAFAGLVSKFQEGTLSNKN